MVPTVSHKLTVEWLCCGRILCPSRGVLSHSLLRSPHDRCSLHYYWSPKHAPRPPTTVLASAPPERTLRGVDGDVGCEAVMALVLGVLVELLL